MPDHYEHPCAPLPASEAWVLYCALEAARCAAHELALDFVRDVLEHFDLDDGEGFGPHHRDFLNGLLTRRHEGPVESDRLVAALACLAAANGAIAAVRVNAPEVPEPPGPHAVLTLSAACPWCGGRRDAARPAARPEDDDLHPAFSCFVCGRDDVRQALLVEAGHRPWDGRIYAAARARTGRGSPRHRPHREAA